MNTQILNSYNILLNTYGHAPFSMGRACCDGFADAFWTCLKAGHIKKTDPAEWLEQIDGVLGPMLVRKPEYRDRADMYVCKV